MRIIISIIIGLAFIGFIMLPSFILEERNVEQLFCGRVTSIIFGHEVLGITVYNNENNYRNIYLVMVKPSTFSSMEDEITEKFLIWLERNM